MILLKKYKPNEEIEFAPVYFNSVTKLIINDRFKLEKSFKKFYIGLIVGLIKDLAGLLNQSNRNTLIFQLISHY